MASRFRAYPAEMRMRRQHKRAHASNSTPGKQKGIRPHGREKLLAKRSGSWKWHDYSNWCLKHDGGKVRRSIG